MDYLIKEFLKNILLPKNAEIIFRNSSTLFIKCWNFEYQHALDLQNRCVEYVKNNPLIKIFILTSHPRIFTMGRGIQRSKTLNLSHLIEFDKNQINALKYPVVYIKRGGGLTFHYLGQWVIYPIINLNHKNNNLKPLIHKILQSIKIVLQELYGLNKLSDKRDYYGLWKDKKKIASLGIEIRKFITLHGIALNLLDDIEMFDSLKDLYPCGLDSSNYRSVESLISENKYLDLDIFSEKFINNFDGTI